MRSKIVLATALAVLVASAVVAAAPQQPSPERSPRFDDLDLVNHSESTQGVQILASPASTYLDADDPEQCVLTGNSFAYPGQDVQVHVDLTGATTTVQPPLQASFWSDFAGPTITLDSQGSGIYTGTIPATNAIHCAELASFDPPEAFLAVMDANGVFYYVNYTFSNVD